MNLRRALSLPNAPWLSLFCTAALTLLISGCATTPPAPEIIPVAGYEGLQEQLVGKDIPFLAEHLARRPFPDRAEGIVPNSGGQSYNFM